MDEAKKALMTEIDNEIVQLQKLKGLVEAYNGDADVLDDMTAEMEAGSEYIRDELFDRLQ